MDRVVTLFINRIPDGVSDTTMQALLETCGRVKRWQRPTDAYTGLPKAFGFCDWLSPAAVLRAQRVLPSAARFVSLGQTEPPPLLLKVDKKLESFLTTYELEHREFTKHMLRLQEAAAEAGAPPPPSRC